MGDHPHHNDNEKQTVQRILSGRDYRLDLALTEYDVLPDERAFLIMEGVKALEAKNKPCVGHLISLSDDALTWLVGDAEIASAMRDWQEQAIRIPRGTRVFDWVPPSQPFIGI